MHALKLGRFPACSLLAMASALFAAGMWSVAHNEGKNVVDTIPLLWLFVLVCAPLLSVGCTAVLCCQRGRPQWLVFLATLLMVPQCVLWFFAVGAVLYYLGLIR